jgi:hypothetical protein
MAPGRWCPTVIDDGRYVPTSSLKAGAAVGMAVSAPVHHPHCARVTDDRVGDFIGS